MGEPELPPAEVLRGPALDTFRAGGSSWGAMDLDFLVVVGPPPPPPTAPYSHAVRAGDFLFVTGQLPADPETGNWSTAGSPNRRIR